MLNVYYGDMPQAIYNTVVYFKNDYDPAWLEDEKVQAMIRDVDHSTVISGGAISSPVMGIIPPTSLSGGVKTLILIDKEPDVVFNASNCGNNCAKWLLTLGEEKDVTINLRHLMDFGDEPFTLKILNDNRVVTNMDEVLTYAGRYV